MEWQGIRLIYDENVLNKLKRNNIAIEDIIHALKHSQKIVITLEENYYGIITKSPKKMTIVTAQTKRNRYALINARECTEKEQELFTHTNK